MLTFSVADGAVVEFFFGKHTKVCDYVFPTGTGMCPPLEVETALLLLGGFKLFLHKNGGLYPNKCLCSSAAVLGVDGCGWSLDGKMFGDPATALSSDAEVLFTGVEFEFSSLDTALSKFSAHARNKPFGSLIFIL